MTIAAGVFIFVSPVYAASYSAEIALPPAKMTLSPGEKGGVSLLVKNIGSVAWPVTGRGYVSAYTFDPKYHLSRLEDKTWRRRDQPATIAAAVKPGASGYLRFPVLAPLEPGVYEETFQLAAEDTAWIAGGKFVVRVEVREKKVSDNLEILKQVQDDKLGVRDDKVVVSTSSALTAPHKALLLARSHRKIEAAGGENILMRFGFKNVGETTWIERGIGYADVALAAVDTLTPALSPQGRGSFVHESWASAREVVKLAVGTVAPGQTEFFTFNVRAPSKAGSYNLRLSLMAGGQAVSGGDIEVPVTVTSNAQNTSGEPVIPLVGGESEPVVLAPEPRIRVGLFKPEQPVEFKSPFIYVLRDANGLVLYELPSGTQAVLHYKKGQYTFYAQGTTLLSETQFRLEPKAVSSTSDGIASSASPPRNDSYFELLNHEDRPTWNRAINYNQFRGVFELRYSKENDKVWAITELPMEEYLAGLAEVSENKVPEFYKAQAVAARTYAYYQLQDGRKHASRNFDVNASQGDQVYAGYVREQTFKKGAEGVSATRGEMMTYNKDVVVTPYFAQSAGRTYSWKEAWGGQDKPWLVSIITHYDKGRIKYGHGVGMSQYDAAKRAEKEGVDYQALLKYYYRGVEVEKVYR
ncbi:MAG: SpoIID/LytB domain-containing protein [Patescibacteria group bacterium]